jgi:hypothetical protein
MLLIDAHGRAFDPGKIEAQLERYEDERLGELVKLAMVDGTRILVRAADLERAAANDSAGSTFFSFWPVTPGSM